MAYPFNAARKVREIRAKHIPTERDEEVEKHLYRLFDVDENGEATGEPTRFTDDQETRGILAIEAAGGGKTTAIRHVLSNAPFLSNDIATGKPLHLEIKVPSPATLKAVGLTILEATGLRELSPNAREWEIWKTVRHRLGLLGVCVLWLDEAQDFIMARNIDDTENTLKMIKSLMQGEHAVIPILSGTRRLAEITSLDQQVSRRFSQIMPADLEHGVDEADLVQMIEAYCEMACIGARISDDLPARLIKASRHRFGRAVETVVNAIEAAFYDGSNVLTNTHFSDAWAMQEGCDPDRNVFLSDYWHSIELDTGEEEYEEARTRRRKKRQERV